MARSGQQVGFLGSDDDEEYKEGELDDMDLIDELETVFHDAQEDLIREDSSLGPMKPFRSKNGELMMIVEETERVKNRY